MPYTLSVCTFLCLCLTVNELKPNSITLSRSQTWSQTWYLSHAEIARTCDLLSTQKSRKLVADPHELVESQVGNQVCDLDSVMEFSLYLSKTYEQILTNSIRICIPPF